LSFGIDVPLVDWFQAWALHVEAVGALAGVVTDIGAIPAYAFLCQLIDHLKELSWFAFARGIGSIPCEGRVDAAA